MTPITHTRRLGMALAWVAAAAVLAFFARSAFLWVLVLYSAPVALLAAFLWPLPPRHPLEDRRAMLTFPWDRR
jgi:hypothetical protein